MGANVTAMSNDIRTEAGRHLRAHFFVERIRKYTDVLTMEEYRQLRNMALDGDLAGANNKLNVILSNRDYRQVSR